MYGKMQESGLTKIIPLMCTSALWGQYLVFSQPEFPQGSLQGVAAIWWLLDGRYSLFPSWVPSGLTSSLLEGCNHWWSWHLCLLIWQAMFYLSMQNNCLYTCKFCPEGSADLSPPVLPPMACLFQDSWALFLFFCFQDSWALESPLYWL